METPTAAPPVRREAPILIRVEEAARLADLGRSTVHKLVAAGELPCVRIGRAVRIRRTDLERWIEANRREPENVSQEPHPDNPEGEAAHG